MRVAMIGLGDIAIKAYLPVLAATPGLELHLVTRDPVRLAALGDAWRIPARHADLDGALAATPRLDAAFVHAATQAHPAIVDQLLRADVPTYVDKPLADSFPEAERLVALAEARRVPLVVGFNRRHAPAYSALRDAPRALVVMAKHRRTSPDAPRRVAFDDFIHVADTLRFLAPGPVERTHIETRVAGGRLEHVALTLSGPGFSCVGLMDRMAGADEEWLEASGGGETRRVEHLRDTWVRRDGRSALVRAPDWRPATWLRGIDQACAAFLADVAAGTFPDPSDALATHRLCEAIVARAETPPPPRRDRRTG
jgi:virulence factor